MTGRLLTTTIAAAAVLLAAPAAQAKEVSAVAICGASDCLRLTQKQLPDEKLHMLADSGVAADAPARRAPWYRVKVTVGPERGEDMERFTYTIAYVPREALIRVRGEGGGYAWLAASPESKTLFAKFTRDLEPLPAKRLTGLDVQPPQAQVDEVFTPATSGAPAPAAATAGSDFPWEWIGAAVAAIALALGAALLVRRRPQPSV